MEFENKKSEVVKEPGSITPIIEEVSETIPKEGTARIRHIELANGKKTWHVEQFGPDNEWLQLREHTNPESAKGHIDTIRSLRVVKNEILDY